MNSPILMFTFRRLAAEVPRCMPGRFADGEDGQRPIAEPKGCWRMTASCDA